MSTPHISFFVRTGGAVREELRPMLKLALPLVFAELGWMAMGVADTVIAGHAGREMLGAVALGHGLYYTFAVFGIGIILDTCGVIPSGASISPGSNSRTSRLRSIQPRATLATIPWKPVANAVRGNASA